ncbi:MAG: hypothetical protein ABIP51_20835 [Bacteroidia bacterium]
MMTNIEVHKGKILNSISLELYITNGYSTVRITTYQQQFCRKLDANSYYWYIIDEMGEAIVKLNFKGRKEEFEEFYDKEVQQCF